MLRLRMAHGLRNRLERPEERVLRLEPPHPLSRGPRRELRGEEVHECIAILYARIIRREPWIVDELRRAGRRAESRPVTRAPGTGHPHAVLGREELVRN